METELKPVFWTNRAVKDLEKATIFNTKLYGFEKAIEIAKNIQRHTEILENNNFKEVGSEDENFDHLVFKYRKLIYNNCKITYREGKTKIYICRIFDTRQNPNKNK